MMPLNISYQTPATVAVTATAKTALAASTLNGPRRYTFQNNGSNTCWIALGGATATAADDQGWIKLAPGDSLEDVTDKSLITVICAATKTTNLSVNGWG